MKYTLLPLRGQGNAENAVQKVRELLLKDSVRLDAPLHLGKVEFKKRKGDKEEEWFVDDEFYLSLSKLEDRLYTLEICRRNEEIVSTAIRKELVMSSEVETWKVTNIKGKTYGIEGLLEDGKSVVIYAQ